MANGHTASLPEWRGRDPTRTQLLVTGCSGLGFRAVCCPHSPGRPRPPREVGRMAAAVL